MPDASIADIIAAGIPRICQPAIFGGLEMPWDVLCEVAVEMAKGCGAQAWVANVYAEHNFLLGHFPEAAQREVWETMPATLISTSYAPSGEVQRVDGGWQMSGKFGFSSGAHNAAWSIVGSLLPIGDDDRPIHCFLLIPNEERTIHDNWHSLGMAATGSVDIEFTDAFVPDHRVLDGRQIAAGKSPGCALNTAPLYKMPHMGFAQTALASVAVGIAKGAVDEFTHTLKTRSVRGRPLAVYQSLQIRLSESAAEAEAARMMILTTARHNMVKVGRGEKLNLADLVLSRRNSAFAVRLAKAATARLFEATGGLGIYNSNHLQRAFRDVHVISGHIALGWDVSATIYGRYAVGLSLDDMI
jgi:alkylation response protein AidB-like acyl-CoA dehydrogenase